MNPCKKCGGEKRNSSGQCIACIKTRGQKRLKDQMPCQVCSARDRDLQGNCKPCRRVWEQRLIRERVPCPTCGTTERSARANCKRCAKSRYILKTYGIRIEEYERLHTQQNRKCTICSSDLVLNKNTHIDHCHKTGIIRALLCTNCNMALGAFDESPILLRAAANYLESFIDYSHFHEKSEA